MMDTSFGLEQLDFPFFLPQRWKATFFSLLLESGGQRSEEIELEKW